MLAPYEAIKQELKSARAMLRRLKAPLVEELTAARAELDDDACRELVLDIDRERLLTPRKYASGEIDRDGAITNSGDQLAQEALFLAAHALLTRVTRWSTLKAWGMSIGKRRGLRRATVAVARKLAVIMHRMWADGIEFRWSRDEATSVVAAA